MTRFLLGLALIPLAACTPPAVALQTVKDAQPQDVVGCAEIGQVTGIPGVYGPLAKIGLNDARNKAKQIALQQGATHVVFDPIRPGETVFEVTGTAYRC
ncbi:MAG: hypothetical protein AAGA08_04595 [Pseudomonadota bacterium]